jgi:transcription elongation factor GreB
MPRLRAPKTTSSPYITAPGYAALRAEQSSLWERRHEVVVHLSAAAAEGDRSENAEYIYRKKQLRELDRRIRYLEHRLPELNVVDRTPDLPVEQVFFGATVALVSEDGVEQSYRIVGADEFDASQQWISIDSPMARALLKRRVDDDVQVSTPTGIREYSVVGISYESA